MSIIRVSESIDDDFDAAVVEAVFIVVIRDKGAVGAVSLALFGESFRL